MTIEPSYYKSFFCTADRCQDNCCRVGWQIALDEDTYKKYLTLKEPERSRVLAAVEGEPGERTIARADGECPLLRGDGLCSLVLSHGEDYLGYICKTHPRFINEYGGITELGVGLACEEAARLIMTDDSPLCLDVSGEEMSAEISELISVRQKLCELVLSGDLYEGIAAALRFAEGADSLSMSTLNVFLKNKYPPLRDYPDFGEIAEAVGTLSEYELMDESSRERLLTFADGLKTRRGRDRSHDAELSRIFIYFIYRYFVSCAVDGDALFSVKLAAVSVILLRELFSGKSEDECIMLAHEYSKELEYSEENMDELRLDMFVCEVFEVEGIIAML